MNVKEFWRDVLRQDAEVLPSYFQDDAIICWHCTNERFTVQEFVRANCEYPGEWAGEIEQTFALSDKYITITRVHAKDDSISFHVTSVFNVQDGKIASLDEYWAGDEEAPLWRRQMRLGHKIR